MKKKKQTKEEKKDINNAMIISAIGVGVCYYLFGSLLKQVVFEDNRFFEIGFWAFGWFVGIGIISRMTSSRKANEKIAYSKK